MEDNTPSQASQTKFEASIACRVTTDLDQSIVADLDIDGASRCTTAGVRNINIKDTDDMPDLAARIVDEYRLANASEATVVYPDTSDIDYFCSLAHCIDIANYRYDLKSADRKTVLTMIELVHPKAVEYMSTEQFKTAIIVAANTNLTRDLHNRRCNVGQVPYFVKWARDLKQSFGGKIDLKVIEAEKELLDEGLRLLHAVGKGSEVGPALICLSYKGNPDSDEFMAMIGKGMVFDQGGMKIKLNDFSNMYADKGGACACLGAFRGIVELGLRQNVVCTVSMAENVVNGTAYRPLRHNYQPQQSDGRDHEHGC